MQEQLTRLQGSWGGMPRRAQLAIVGVAAVTILVMYFVLRAATGTTWVPVADNLPADKLGQAQTVLDTAGIANQVSGSGNSIEVAAADQPKAAAALIPAGIAAKGGRSGCAKQSEKGGSIMAQTSAATALMLETCHENDAANTIEGVEGVNHATVDATLPGKSLFSEDAEEAKAAVMLDTGGTSLSKKSVAGIQATVAAGFEGLKAKNVTVTDETGAVIGGDGSAEGNESSMSKLDAEAKMNAKIEHDLGTKLDALVGPGKSIISSNVQLDMDTITRGVHKAEPAGKDGDQLVKDESVQSELLDNGTDTTTQGVTGTGTNVGVDATGTSTTDNRTTTADPTATSPAGNDYVKKDSSTNYDNNVIEEKIGVAQGAVQRFRIGLIIDRSVDDDTALAAKNMVLAWSGGDPENSLSFDHVKIAGAKSAAASTGPSRTDAIASYVKWALLGLGLICLAFVMRRSLTQRTAELLAPADDLLLLEGGDFSPIPIAELEAALAAGQPDSERRGRIEMQKKVERIAESKPQDVANELRRWMHHDDPAYAASRKG
jgi:flagellar M-ring protein FliF